MTINRLKKMTIKPTAPSKPNNKAITRTPSKTTRLGGHTQSTGPTVGPGPGILVKSPSGTSLPTTAEEHQEDQQQQKSEKKFLRALFVWLYTIHSIICLIFIVGTLVILIVAQNHKMQYFMRRSGSTKFSQVETGSKWMASKFLMGSLTHLIVGVLGASVLSGGKWSQDLIERALDKIKIFFWLGVIAALGCVGMLDGTLDYIISVPVVQNGVFKDTISPPSTDEGHTPDCLNETEVQPNIDIHANVGLVFIRTNLKWFVEVLCATTKDHGHDVPVWEKYFTESETARGHSADCKGHIHHLGVSAKEDCSNALLLYYIIVAWIVLVILGILFAGSLFYLNIRLTIKLTPTPRFSFAGLTATEAHDLERLKTVAQRVRRLGSKKNFLEQSGSHTHIVFADNPSPTAD